MVLTPEQAASSPMHQALCASNAPQKLGAVCTRVRLTPTHLAALLLCIDSLAQGKGYLNLIELPRNPCSTCPSRPTCWACCPNVYKPG